MKSKKLLWTLTMVTVGLLTGCNTTFEDGGSSSSITIQSALTAGTHDVGGFFYEISCDNGFELTEYVPLESEYIPEWVDSDAGPSHFFSDLLAVIPPGDCTVTATPMQNEGLASEECHPVTGEFSVEEEKTSEIVLMAQCDANPNGAADIVAGLNDAPIIIDLTLDPSKFIKKCEPLDITVSAEDANGDALTYLWEVVTMPQDAIFMLSANGPAVKFLSKTPGYFELRVTVTDTYGASTELVFPVHVTDVPGLVNCNNPDCLSFEVFDDGGLPADGETVFDQYSNYGVEFKLLERGTWTEAGFPTVAKTGAPLTAFQSPHAPDSIHTPYIGFDLGEYFITDNTGINLNTDLLITYTTPVTQTGGWVLDVDCFAGEWDATGRCEFWEITAYDENKVEISSTRIGPNFGETTAHTAAGSISAGDGLGQVWYFDESTEIHFVRLHYDGTKPLSNVGVAFDHFCTDELPFVDL